MTDLRPTSHEFAQALRRAVGFHSRIHVRSLPGGIPTRGAATTPSAVAVGTGRSTGGGGTGVGEDRRSPASTPDSARDPGAGAPIRS
jgi:hypothetical protein